MTHKNLTINECWGDNGWNWRKILGCGTNIDYGLNTTISLLMARVSNFKTEKGPDSVHWRWTPDGLFSIKSTYSLLCDGGTRDVRARKIWKLRIPLKVKVFCWLVLKKRTPTVENLLKRGWVGNTYCVLCRTEEESVDHLFTQCVFFRFLVVKTLEDVELRDLGEEVTLVSDIWKNRKGSANSSPGLIGLIACWWVVWEAKNGAIFRLTRQDPFNEIYKINQLTSQWEQLRPSAGDNCTG